VIFTILFLQGDIKARFNHSRETCHGEEKEKKEEKRDVEKKKKYGESRCLF
jgi:hypothetical protein